MQMVVTFNCSFDTGCLIFKFLYNIVASNVFKVVSFRWDIMITSIQCKCCTFHKVELWHFSGVVDKCVRASVVFRIL